jgi:hypothetical protein
MKGPQQKSFSVITVDDHDESWGNWKGDGRHGMPWPFDQRQ